jgi:hypothetical protein
MGLLNSNSIKGRQSNATEFTKERIVFAKGELVFKDTYKG